MALSWSDRRQFMYSGVVVLILLALAWAIYSSYFSAPPTCFDNKQNGDEQGIDCGGSCSLICSASAKQPVVSWARSFLTATSSAAGTSNIYTAAAYIQNPNVGAGAHNVAYSFQLFDADNHLVVEKTGVIDLPPVPTVPIIESNIDAGSRTVARTLFSFSGLPSWNLLQAGSIAQVSLSNQQLSADGTRLSLTINNATTVDAHSMTVAAVLFDVNGAALAASKSVIPSLPHKSSQNVVLTWPQPVLGVVRAEVTVLPSF